MPANISTLFSPGYLTSSTFRSIARGERVYASDLCAPPVLQGRQDGFLANVDPDDELLRVSTNHLAPGAIPESFALEVSKTNAYNCKKYAYDMIVTDEQLAAIAGDGGAPIDYWTRQGSAALNKAMLVKDLIFKALQDSVFTGAQTSSPSVKWNAANGKPITDIVAKMVLPGQSNGDGILNALLIDKITLTLLTNSDEFKKATSSGFENEDRTIGTIAKKLKMATGLDHLIVTDDVKVKIANTVSNPWYGRALLFRISQDPNAFTGTFLQPVWNMPQMFSEAAKISGVNNGYLVEQIREERHNMYIVRARSYYDFITPRSRNAHLFTSVLA
jgi:hypothetical protein